MDAKEYVETMKEVAAKIEKLEAKRAVCAEAAEQKVYQDLIDDANAEFQGLEGKVAAAKEAERKAKLLEDIDAKRNAVDAKSDKLTDASVPDSEHNEGHNDIENTKVFTEYFTSEKVSSYLNTLAGKKGDIYVENRMMDGGMKLPNWMAKNVLPQPVGADYEAQIESAIHEGKDVLVREASGTNAGGGSLVEEMFNAQLFKVAKRGDSIPDMCFVKRGVGKEVQFPKLTQSTNEYGVSVAWGNAGAANGEGTAVTESNPVFTRIDVNLERLALLSQASLREVRVNQVGFEAELMWMYRGAAERALSRAILFGVAGVTNAPEGIASNAGTTAGVLSVPRQTAAQVSYTDLVNMQFEVDDGVFGTGTFVLSAGSSGAMKYIAALDDTAGRPIFGGDSQSGWGVGAAPSIAGSPYISTVANNKALGSSGDVIFGNFMGYGLAVDSQIAVERSDEYAFNQGLVTYRMIMYVGGKVLGGEMFSVLDDVSTASSSSSS